MNKRNLNKALIAFAFSGIAGGAAWALAKSKKSQIIITMDEAEDIVVKETTPTGMTQITPEGVVITEEEELDNEETETEEKPKEVHRLRKGLDPNSREAYDSYINMMLAEFDRDSLEDTAMRRLFEIPFVPVTLGDKGIHIALKEERSRFFGKGSEWAKELAWADIFLWYADKLAYHLEDNQESWVGFMLDHLDIQVDTSNEELGCILEELEQHDYVNNSTGLFGMFGLDDQGMDFLNGQLTYAVEKTHSFETELNAFLQMAMSGDEDDDEETI